MFLMVKVRVSPGLRLGSPVSPMLVSSLTLLAPVVTGAGGSPASVIGELVERDVGLEDDGFVVDGAGVLHDEGDVTGGRGRG